ncbi:LuxR C-terminal-related transcriptional regulator, partial [Alistipes putredinis]|uniref:LuxR C-terminal-related transcriptional regulator n=1 Tax=Alistipes putredinis TaxID=28117 RepID=UPI003A87F403
NTQIADRLQSGLTNVISHRRNIMQKLGVQSVAALVICAVSMGYVDESDIRTPHK